MTFQPVVPLSGYVGWTFLQRTLQNQQAAFTESAPISRATAYFRENIENIRTAEDLVSDRRLLEVALGAFGLDEDINNTFFIRKVLEEGTIDDDALANRLSDNRYAEFSRAFGFGDYTTPRTANRALQDDIVDRFEARQFERAVGDQDNDLRLAMTVATGVRDITKDTTSTAAQWFSVMGNAPLRNVFETALGLPSSLARIDIDQQLETFQERAAAVFGTTDLSDFNDPTLQEKLIRLFLVRSETATGAFSSGGSTALTLLQSAPRLFA